MKNILNKSVHPNHFLLVLNQVELFIGMKFLKKIGINNFINLKWKLEYYCYGRVSAIHYILSLRIKFFVPEYCTVRRVLTWSSRLITLQTSNSVSKTIWTPYWPLCNHGWILQLHPCKILLSRSLVNFIAFNRSPDVDLLTTTVN